MNISELSVGMKDITLEAKVSEKSEPREVQTRFGRRLVADVMVKDKTGSIKLSLWEKQIDAVKEGDEIEITGAYVTEWRGSLQLSIPKTGKLAVLDKAKKGLAEF
ncbi:MAG: DNA-binding protein [Candidatus Aenigmarchaeota archaeon]|nr:DNA-binding protein [Candidatus Aenigmarchaeota archaeon]